MPKSAHPIVTTPSSKITGSEKQSLKEPQKRCWSHIALGLGAAIISSAKTNPGTTSAVACVAVATGFAGIKSLPSFRQTTVFTPSNTGATYPRGVVADFLHNGTFGAPLEDGLRLDGVVVARGDRERNVVHDPYNEGGGIILSDQAKKIFDRYSQDPKFASPEGQFKLAILSAIKIREAFLQRPVSGPKGQNDIASIHLADSKALKGGSPLLSLTLNNFTAAYFGLGGVDNSGATKPVNQDGKVFLARVNNASTIYPAVGGKVKGIPAGNDPRPVSDRGMTLASDMNIPFSEMLIVGGYYFHNSLSVQQAFKQPLHTLRQIPDLYGSSLSFQMLEPIEGRVEFYPYQGHLPRIQKSLKNGD